MQIALISITTVLSAQIAVKPIVYMVQVVQQVSPLVAIQEHTIAQ